MSAKREKADKQITVHLVCVINGEKVKRDFTSADLAGKLLESWRQGVHNMISNGIGNGSFEYLISRDRIVNHPNALNNKCYCPYHSICQNGNGCKRKPEKRIEDLVKKKDMRVARFWWKPCCFVEKIIN